MQVTGILSTQHVRSSLNTSILKLEHESSPKSISIMPTTAFIALLALVHPAISQNVLDNGGDSHGEPPDFLPDHPHPVRIQI
jgi:hypothetical protein